MSDLNIADIPYPSGGIQFRYSRYLSSDGAKWIRHGLFQAFHENGALASEGMYEHGAEQGIWRDYHSNGKLAAEGKYESGNETDIWQYWSPEGGRQE